MNPQNVKCGNKNCGLITSISNWREVPLEPDSKVRVLTCPRCNSDSYFVAKPGEVENPKSGAQLIALERNRQMLIEGWSPEHDDAHVRGELLDAGLSYIRAAINIGHPAMRTPPRVWPWDKSWWKPSNDRVRNLVKAGALISAEIDRLQRLNKQG